MVHPRSRSWGSLRANKSSIALTVSSLFRMLSSGSTPHISLVLAVAATTDFRDFDRGSEGDRSLK